MAYHNDEEKDKDDVGVTDDALGEVFGHDEDEEDDIPDSEADAEE